MKILQIFAWVVGAHVFAFFCIFASPGCSSSPRNVPTPDATVPTVSSSGAGLSYPSAAAETLPAPDHLGFAPEGTPGRVAPTRPGSPNAAAITPAKATASVASVVPYTIQKGDSLWTIAKKNHITVAELTKTNNLTKTSSLKPGKKLMIPVKTPVAAPAESAVALPTLPAAANNTTPAEAAAVRNSAEVVKHVVGSGESLGIIARKYGVTVGELAAANNITDPAKIRVGQPLVIPSGKGGAKNSGKSAGKTASPASTKPVSTTASKPVPATPRVETPAAPASQPEVKPTPAGQDLDAGLTESASTEVPTIKVEEPKSEEPAK